ncbi:MAG: hypothetical protein FWF77_04615 [Defluviitaleaceae bacterium]|nr:hypothetical protein [Defluviitaleaceae bacterium]
MFSLSIPPLFRRFEKARQARSGHRGHVSKSAHFLEAGSNFLTHEKKSRRVSLADSFFMGRENRSRLRGNASPPTHAPGAHRALGALTSSLVPSVVPQVRTA